MRKHFPIFLKQIKGGASKAPYQGTYGIGKTGKMAKKILSGKTQGILFVQVVNVLILKVKIIAIVAPNEINFFPRSWIGLPSLCVCNTHKLCYLAQGKIAVRQGKHREFENTI